MSWRGLCFGQHFVRESGPFVLLEPFGQIQADFLHHQRLIPESENGIGHQQKTKGVDVNRTKQIDAGWRNASMLARVGALAVVLAAGAIGATAPGVLHAQATSGYIVGHAPAGDTIEVKGAGGMHRRTKVKDNGRYAVRALPVGVYMVTLFKDGDEMDTRYNVKLRVGAGYKVDFACKNDQCAKQDEAVH